MTKAAKEADASVSMLLAEFDALYRLVEYRMASLDRRVPAATALLTTFVGLVPLVPGASGLVLLAVIPVSLIWLMRTTINHARSLEDLLRGIETIETRLNHIVGTDVVTFQSRHPSRGRTVGGRTGVETIAAVSMATALLLGACLYLVSLSAAAHEVVSLRVGYAVYIALIAGYAIVLICKLNRYGSHRAEAVSKSR